MDFNQAKIEEVMLALMYYNSYGEKPLGLRTWKSYPWEFMDALHEKEFISNPATKKSKSVVLTQEGFDKGKASFEKHFGKA